MSKLRTLVAAGDPPRQPVLLARLAASPALCVDVLDEAHIASSIAVDEPDAVVYEVCPCGEGLEAFLKSICSAQPTPPVVVLGDSPERIVPVLRAATRLPAWGYLGKDACPEKIAAAVRAVAMGLLVSETGHCGPTATSDELHTQEPLTPRETEVLRLMAAGLPNKIIAHRLGISLHTAKFHVARVLAKLRAASRTEAVAAGARSGVIAL